MTFPFFAILCFLPFWTSKWPENSNLTWFAQYDLRMLNLFYFIFFYNHFMCASKIHFKIIFEFFRSIIWTLNAFFGLKHFKSLENGLTITSGQLFADSVMFTSIIIKLKSFLALLERLLHSTFELLNFVKWSKPHQTPLHTFWTVCSCF